MELRQVVTEPTENLKSMITQENIKSEIKTFILNEFLPGEDPSELTDTTALMTTGILDSIAVLKVVTFLESHFGITLEAHETGVENLNTIADITHLVLAKKTP